MKKAKSNPTSKRQSMAGMALIILSPFIAWLITVGVIRMLGDSKEYWTYSPVFYTVILLVFAYLGTLLTISSFKNKIKQ